MKSLMPYLNRRLLATFGLCGALSLSACSTYVGHKLAADGTLPPDSRGVPFVMTKQEFTLKVAPDAQDETVPVYTIEKKSVPDRNQRYSITLDPALLVDGEFNLSFGADGNITDAVATTTSQVVATIKALASFLAERAASSQLKDEGTLWVRYSDLVQANTKPACTADGAKSGQSVGNELVAQMVEFNTLALQELTESDEKKRKAQAEARVAERFHPLSDQQRKCLQAVHSDAEKYVANEENKVKEGYDVAIAQVTTAHRVTSTSGDGVPPGVKDWVASKALGDLQRAHEQVTDKMSPLAKVYEEAIKFVKTQTESPVVRELARFYAYMPLEIWRSRHLQHLDRTLASKRFALLQQPRTKENEEARAKIQAEIATLETDSALVLGEQLVFQRIATLDNFLTTIRMTQAPGSGQRVAAEEHVKLRGERDFLQSRIEQARSDLVAKNQTPAITTPKAKPPPKVKPRSAIPVTVATQKSVDDINNAPSGAPAEGPEFLLVLTPVVDAVTPSAKGSKP